MGVRPRIGVVSVALLGALVTMTSPGITLAQDTTEADDTERARALFEEGVAHVDAEEWEEAAAKFREALALRDAPAVRYNLASALVALEEYTEAEAIARPLVDDPETDPAIRERTQELLDQIGRAAGRLTVDVRGATAGVTVRIDGEDVEPSSVVHSYSLPARGYTVVVERNGREIERREVSVASGENAQVSVAVAPSPEETAEAAEGTPAPDGGSGRADIVNDWRFWTAVGAAVVLAVLLAIVASQ